MVKTQTNNHNNNEDDNDNANRTVYLVNGVLLIRSDGHVLFWVTANRMPPAQATSSAYARPSAGCVCVRVCVSVCACVRACVHIGVRVCACSV